MKIGCSVPGNLTEICYYTSLGISLNTVTNVREQVLDSLDYHQKQLQHRPQQVPSKYVYWLSRDMLCTAFWFIDLTENWMKAMSLYSRKMHIWTKHF